MGAWDITAEKCPYCGEECEADFVDVGVGMVQCGPYHCMNCSASEIGAHDEPRPLTTEEEKTGWYAPHTPPSDTANTVNGMIVDHKTAKGLYDLGLLDPWDDKPKPDHHEE